MQLKYSSAAGLREQLLFRVYAKVETFWGTFIIFQKTSTNQVDLLLTIRNSTFAGKNSVKEQKQNVQSGYLEKSSAVYNETGIQQMSFIIDQTDNFFFRQTVSQSEPRWNIYRRSSERQTINSALTSLTLELNNKSNQLVSTSRDQQVQITRFLLNRIYKAFSVLLIVRVHLRTYQMSFSLKLLNKHGNYLKVEGRERIKMICKYVNSRFFQFLVAQYNINVNIHNGEVLFKMPGFYILSHYHTKKIVDQLIKSIKEYFTGSMQGFNQTLSLISQVSNSNFEGNYVQQKSHLSKESFFQYYQRFKIVNMFLYVCSESTHQEEFLKTQIQKQLSSIQSLKEKHINSKQQFLSVCLYNQETIENLKDEKCPVLHLDGKQKNDIKSRIEMASMPKWTETQDNNYILNHIILSKPLSSFRMEILASGGFTTILGAQIEFKYISSEATKQDVQRETRNRALRKKNVVIKKQNPRFLQGGKRSRIAHQKFILTKIKNGVSLYFNKYYFLLGNDPDDNCTLISDYIQGPTLYNYCLQNKQTLSFHTKIYLCIMIAQSLRYLSEYNIAHLDLKPTNIMVARKLRTKLIDFGESYHPELKNHHKPGFSMPYSAPEIYNSPSSYDYKNDVFSFGVMMHQLFLDRYPFFFHNDKLRQEVYRNGDFSQRWFHCSQGNAFVGQSVVFPLIEALIVRCIHSDPWNRPQLEWIVYILRGCLEYFY